MPARRTARSLPPHSGQERPSCGCAAPIRKSSYALCGSSKSRAGAMSISTAVPRKPTRAADRAGGAPASALRAVALDRLGVGRIGTHIDAALPAALQRVDDAEPHTADALDLDLDAFAVLQGAEPFVIGAASNQVARIEGHDR